MAGVHAGHLWPEISSSPSQCFREALCCRDFSKEVGYIALVVVVGRTALSPYDRKQTNVMLSYRFVFFTTQSMCKVKKPVKCFLQEKDNAVYGVVQANLFFTDLRGYFWCFPWGKVAKPDNFPDDLTHLSVLCTRS